MIIFSILLTSCVWFRTAPEEDERENIAEKYVLDGIQQFQAGNDSLAINKWEKALAIIPDDAEIHNFCGIARHRLNDYPNALVDFRNAIKYFSEYYEALNNAGYMSFKMMQYEKALEYFNRSLNINSQYMPAIKNKRLVESILQGDLDREVFEISEAVAQKWNSEDQVKGYKKVLALDSSFAKAHNNLAVAYFYEDYQDSAYIHLLKAIQLKKDYPEALNNLACLYKINEKYETAIQLFFKALMLKPRYIAALNNLGETYYLMNEYHNAKRVFKTTLALSKEDEVAAAWLERIQAEERY
jgi:Flp pilus assembly protein TadD